MSFQLSFRRTLLTLWYESGSGTSNRTGLIVGIVVGVVALAALLLFAFFFWRRKRAQKARRYGGTKEVDLLKSDKHPGPMAAMDGHTFEPTPFYTPPRQSTSNGTRPNTAGTRPNTAGHRPSASGDTTGYGADPSVDSHDPLAPPSAWNPRAVGPAGVASSGYGTSTGRSDVDGTTDTGSNVNGSDYAPASPTMAKSAEGPASSRMRPMNIIQHQDGGVLPVSPPVGEDEVVELPPSYNDARAAAASTRGTP